MSLEKITNNIEKCKECYEKYQLFFVKNVIVVCAKNVGN